MKNLTKKTLYIVAGIMVSASVMASDGWLTDFAAAQKEAVARNVPILVDFSGSDWCGWCKRLDKKVFSQPAFKEYAEKNLVLFIADFPRKSTLSPAIEKQNKELMKKFGVRGFPTILILNKEGKKIAQTGYQRGGAEAYVEHLKELITAE